MHSYMFRVIRRAGLVLLCTTSAVAAQTRLPSQHASLSQTVGGTEVTIEYNRPVARGRLLFGGIVPWSKEWDPGADSATRLRFNTEVVINGKSLAAGEYSLWAIPDSAAWTVIFSRAAHVYHIPYPAGQDALRIRVAPRPGAHMETLALYFPVVDGSTAVLNLHWGTTVVPLTIRGQP